MFLITTIESLVLIILRVNDRIYYNIDRKYALRRHSNSGNQDNDRLRRFGRRRIHDLHAIFIIFGFFFFLSMFFRTFQRLKPLFNDFHDHYPFSTSETHPTQTSTHTCLSEILQSRENRMSQGLRNRFRKRDKPQFFHLRFRISIH